MPPLPYTRLIVIGATGAGKSTLAENLANKLGLEWIELDALHWLPGWQSRPLEDFRARTEQATQGPRWVIAGNYSSVRDLTWPRAELIIWLDYPLWTIFWRLWHRTWKRWWTRELLWGTNRENMLDHFKLWSKQDSLFAWLFATYWRRKREFPLLIAAHPHLQLIHLRTPRETQQWFESLE